jgi:intein/homing endonuclease
VSVHPESERSLSRATWRLKMPLSISVQILRHRSGCLSGDTLLYFDMPTAKKSNKRRRHSVSIKDFYSRWHNGISMTHQRLRKDSGVDKVDLNKKYTPVQLGALVNRSSENIRNLCQKNIIKFEKNGKYITILGKDWVEYCNTDITIGFNIRDRLKEQNLRMCNEESGEIQHTNITDIWETGVKPVYKVTLENGYSIKMTKDHRCLTDNGWKTLEEAVDLRHGDNSVSWNPSLNQFSVNGSFLYKDKDWLTAKRKESPLLSITQIAEAAGVSYHAIRKWLKIYGLSFTPKETAVLSSKTQTGMKKVIKNPRPKSEAELRALSERSRGEKNNFWKGGVTKERHLIGSWTRNVSKHIFARDNYKCAICNGSEKLNAHHIDPVWHNKELGYDKDNLKTLCGNCHRRLHANNLELNFLKDHIEKNSLHDFFDRNNVKVSAKEIQKPKGNSAKLIRKYSRVKKIEYVGEEKTYDISVAGPYHNFVANGFVVHNSFNQVSGRYKTIHQEVIPPVDDCTQIARKIGMDLGEYLDSTNIIIERYEGAMSSAKKAKEEGLISNEEYKRFREFARFILPEGRMTEMYVTFYLDDFYNNYLPLRNSTHAQTEHIWISQEMQRTLEEYSGA